MFWTRRQPLTVDFIHFSRHGSTYGAPINFSVSITAYFGIRVLNDVFPAAIPNGPCSDSLDLRSGGYHLRFNAKSGDTYERCIDDLARFVSEVGEPWFQKFQSVDSLLQLPDSPLRSPEKQLLIDAIEDRAKPENETNSLKILGIKLT